MWVVENQKEESENYFSNKSNTENIVTEWPF